MASRGAWLTGLAAATATVAAMGLAAKAGQTVIAVLAAAAFAVVAVAVALAANRADSAGEGERAAAPVTLAAALNARLIALAYGWGAAAFLAVYPLSGLKWQHWWQYGLAMALIAAALLAYASMVSRPGSQLDTPAGLAVVHAATIAQAVAAVAGLAWLIASGKAISTRVDWLANVIFVAGGLAVAALSAIAALTHRRLSRPEGPGQE